MGTGISWEDLEGSLGFRHEEKGADGEGCAYGGIWHFIGTNNGARVERAGPYGGLFPYFH